jgi:LDH2 family malate/lactate/ureidoglycolate dehydrogenase
MAFAIQALGLLAGAAIPRGQVQDYGFLFLVVDPGALLPGNPFAAQMSQLVKAIQATPRRPGVEEIRIPSQRAFRERERRRAEGILVDDAVIAALRRYDPASRRYSSASLMPRHLDPSQEENACPKNR